MRAAALALISWTLVHAVAAQQFQPVPPPAAGRSAIAGAPYLAEGEAAVIRPLEKDFEIVARVRHDAWRALAR